MPDASLARILALSILLMTVLTPLGCRKAADEAVVEPIAQAQTLKEQAALDTALANGRTVRDALMRYPASAPDSKYPTDTEVYDYPSLRRTLGGTLPSGMEALMWDPAVGISYRSDGYTFTLEVRALTRKGETITITEHEVTW